MILLVALFLSGKNIHNQKKKEEGTVAQIGDDAVVGTMAGYTNLSSGPHGSVMAPHQSFSHPRDKPMAETSLGMISLSTVQPKRMAGRVAIQW